jgi:hypothetical protein
MQTKKKQVKQQIVSTCIILFMLVMVFGTVGVDLLMAANTSTTTLIQNITAGTLGIEAPATVGFSNLTLGTAGTSTGNLTQVNMWDYRGSGLGWSITATMNHLTLNTTVPSGAVGNILNSAVRWWTGTPAIVTGSLSSVSAGADGENFDGSVTLVQALSGAGMGNYRINGTTLNVEYNGNPTQAAGTYNATLTMNII